MIITSGSASAFLFSYATVPGISPNDGSSGSTFSTIVLGINVPPGVVGRSDSNTLDALRLLAWSLPSGIISISSGTASCFLFSYALVPGISP